MQPKRVFIATLVVLATIFGAFLIYELRGVILTAYAAFILAAAIKAPVEFLRGRGVPRPLAVVLIYLAVILIFAGVILIVVPPVARESETLVHRWPELQVQLQD